VNVAARAVQLLERTDAGRRPVRLLGVSVHNFCRDDEDASDSNRLPFDENLESGNAGDTENTTSMLKGTRDGILKKAQPISIHGQLSWDIFFTAVDDPDGQIHVARLGPEAITHNLEPGDRIQVEYLVGVAVRVSRVVPT
jgi:hypothetical protein